MAQLDFPAAPSNGQIFTPVAGGPSWQWDGTKWIAATTGSTAYAPLTDPVFLGNPQAPTPAASDNDTSIATTAFVSAAVATSLHDVGRNLIHNSMFNVAQRGAGPFTTAVYTLDRWVTALAASDTVGITQAILTDANRTSIGDEAAVYCLSVNIVGGTGHTYIQQPIEGVRRLAGKTVTVSFWSNASAALKLGVNILQNFGTGGSPSAGLWVQATGNAVTLSSTFTRFSTTFAIPSIIGKTTGTNNNDYHGLAFWYSAGDGTAALGGNIGVQSGIVNLWGVQLELGPTATPLEKLDPVTQLQQCQRFFQIGSWGAAGASSAAGAGQTFTMPYPVPMRAMPIMTPTFTLQTNCGSSRVDLAGNYACAPYTINTATGGWAFNGTFTASADP